MAGEEEYSIDSMAQSDADFYGNIDPLYDSIGGMGSLGGTQANRAGAGVAPAMTDAEKSRVEDYMKGYEEQYNKVDRSQLERDEASMKAAFDKRRATMTAGPQLEQMPEVPLNTQLSHVSEETKLAGGILMIAAVAGTFAMRGTARDMFANMDGVLKGMLNGHEAAVNDNLKNYHENLKKLQENNKIRMATYENILKRDDIDVQEKMELFKIHAGSIKDETAMRIGNYKDALGHLDKARAYEAQMKRASMFGSGRMYDVFNPKNGAIVKVPGNIYAQTYSDFPISPNDPDFKDLNKQMPWTTQQKRSLDKIHAHQKFIEDFVKKHGMSDSTKPFNVLVQDLVDRRMLGKEEATSLYIMVNELSAEQGRFAMGFGSSATPIHKDKLDEFKVNPQMPAKDLIGHLRNTTAYGETAIAPYNKSIYGIYERLYDKVSQPIPDNIKRAWGPSSAASSSSTSGRVKVADKNGKVGTIPKSQLAAAKAQGYTEVTDAIGD